MPPADRRDPLTDASHSDRGVTSDEQGQEQPVDTAPAPSPPRSHPDKSARREATRDPRLNDPEKTPGSGMTPDDGGDAPTG